MFRENYFKFKRTKTLFGMSCSFTYGVRFIRICTSKFVKGFSIQFSPDEIIVFTLQKYLKVSRRQKWDLFWYENVLLLSWSSVRSFKKTDLFIRETYDNFQA